MSGSENFLGRWSRRKQNARQEPKDDTKPPANPAPGTEGENNARSSTDAAKPPSGADGVAKVPAQEPAPAFDIASLPSIESITAGTDVRAFLAPGVPQHLTRAALRRAWSADPAIREYIGLSEYSWDFNAPDSMFGFEPLRASDDVKKLLAEVFSEREKPDDQRTAARETEPADGATAQSGGKAAALPGSTAEIPGATPQEPPAPAEALANEAAIVQRNENNAVQHDAKPGDSDRARSRPRHGGALPKA
ncbi:MAG: DUF3306 domain-containing protein [Alphaproteobacteria bacterium]|nr:DUF3306 domain-containing protein [Alphaproteobacteria bacterium]